MWVSRRVYDDLKKEHQRTIEALTVFIEHLQQQVGAPAAPMIAPAPAGKPPDMSLYVGDEEQDLRDAREMGLIDEDQFAEGMRQLAIGNTEVFAS